MLNKSDTDSIINVIDLFAGPGGLSEGFSTFKHFDITPFKIKLSIEKDTTAFATLQLRSFFRQFDKSEVPTQYYEYLRGKITKSELFDKFKDQYKKANTETWNAELGVVSQEIVSEKIERAIADNKKWILIGGPPCQAYSLMGRVKIKDVNKKKQKDFEEDHRHFLYQEYLKIITRFNPPIFIMENVPGILSSKLKGQKIFNKIIRDLQNPFDAIGNNKNLYKNNFCSYTIYSFVNKASKGTDLMNNEYIIKFEDFGIPQARHRVILLGIRSDLEVEPDLLKKSAKKFSIFDVIGDLPRIRSKLSKEQDSDQKWLSIIRSIPETDWFIKSNIDNLLKNEIISISINNLAPLPLGKEFIYGTQNSNPILQEWFIDKRLKGVCNHSSRSHIREDLYRYFFAICFAKIYKFSPKIKNFPEKLFPNHKNINKALKNNLFSDRFRVQLEEKPSTTITSHISKDGHYYIYPDATQCRSLTVREAARLQTFPDNYYFEGNRTAQYHQVGNAVPPLLAKQVAEVVWKVAKKIKNY